MSAEGTSSLDQHQIPHTRFDARATHPGVMGWSAVLRTRQPFGCPSERVKGRQSCRSTTQWLLLHAFTEVTGCPPPDGPSQSDQSCHEGDNMPELIALGSADLGRIRPVDPERASGLGAYGNTTSEEA